MSAPTAPPPGRAVAGRPPAVVAEHVGKVYLTDGGARTLRSFGFLHRRTPVRALQDVSLSIAEGETLGLLGTNGSGKSTLLRLLAGITRPTTGRVQLRGRTGGLLTLGEGLDPLLTGEENALTGALLAGLPIREARRRLDDIAAFAGLEHVMDQPLRTYSDGMRLRLAFSAAIHVEPDVLLVDEILAVGDLAFRTRCAERLGELQARGTTIVVASHDLGQLLELCTRAVWLDRGRVAGLGAVTEVVEAYEAAQRERLPDAARVTPAGRRIGTGEVEVVDVALRGAREGEGVPVVPVGRPVAVEITTVAAQPVADPIVGVSVHAIPDGTRCMDLSTTADGASIGTLEGRRTIRLELDRMDLAGGRYHLDVGVYAAGWAGTYDYRWRVLEFDVAAPVTPAPWVPPHRWLA